MARYTEWTHVRVLGAPHEAGAPYIAEGRKLLGAVMDDAKVNGLGTHKMRKELPDGTVIVAEKHGEIPRITIYPVIPVNPVKKVALPGDFVVWARNAALPDGIDPDYPQQILRPSESGDSWNTFFYSDSTAGYELFGGEKGTYVGTFPEGIAHAGNCDWWSGEETDLRISWYGPSCNVWQDGYVQPSAEYGPYVFMLGKVLLDTFDYSANSEYGFDGDTHIVGAALRKIGALWYLYTAQVFLNDIETAPIYIDSEDVDRVFSSPNAGTGVATISFYRFDLIQTTDIAGVERFTVAYDSAIFLLGTDLFGSDPWFFNKDCTRAVAYTGAQYHAPYHGSASPESGGWGATILDPVYLDPGDWDTFLPTETQDIVTVALDEEEASILTTETVSITNDNTPVPIAVAYDKDGNRVEMTCRVTPDMLVFFNQDGTDHNMWEVQEYNAGGINYADGTKKWVFYSSLRDGVLVLLTRRLRFTTDFISAFERFGAHVEIWRNGELVHTQEVITAAEQASYSFGLGDYFFANARKWDGLKGVNIFPRFWVYGVCFVLVPGDEDFPGTNLDFCGAVASFAAILRPADQYFGLWDIGSATPHWAASIGELSPEGFNATRIDKDGYYSDLGCAANENVMSLSMGIPTVDGDRSFSYVTGNSLGVLTGVGSTDARYHPIWRLGKPAAPLP